MDHHGRSSTAAASRLTAPLILLLLLCGLSFGVLARVAWADASYHTTCVGHGFVSGSAPNDNSFFSRVDPGCGSTTRTCYLYTWGSLDGYESVGGTTATCNAWSNYFGNYTECGSSAYVVNSGVFSSHTHLPSNWCG